MWLIFFSIVLLLVVLKIWKISQFWKDKGIVYEPFSEYVYRLVWILSTRGLIEFHAIPAKKYGRLFGSYKGFTPTLMSTDVEVAKEVLIKQFDNFFKRSFEVETGDPFWDKTLVNLPHDQWKTMRSLMGHAYTSAKMKQMCLRFDVMAKRLVKRINAQAKSNGGYIEKAFFEYAKPYAVDSTMAIAYGKDPNCIENPESPFLKDTKITPQPGLGTFLFIAAPHLLRYFRHVPRTSFPPKETTDFFVKLADQMFKEKRAKLDEVAASGTADMIDRLLLTQRQDPTLTDELIGSQAFMFVVAGVDTTAMAISITTYYWAIFPDAQRKAFQELKSVLGDRKEITHEDTQAMRYMEGCVQESFRFFPFSTFVDRICTRDTVVSGVPIKKGMKVELLAFEMMQSAEYFPEPMTFRPDRFVKGEFMEKQEHGAYLTFGDGPKHCAGKRLALINSTAALANMLLAFEFEKCPETPAHPLKMKPGLEFDTMTEKPLVIRIKPRN